MITVRRRWPLEVVFVFCAFALVLLVHGALPGIAMPTLGQAIWTTSFSQSFANEGLISIHAHDFGYPMPAAMSFGLPGAIPCAWLIRAGLPPADAYTAMVAAWLAVAFAGAMLLGQRAGANGRMAACMAALWLCTPMVWAHVDYSMLGLGMALMPTYFWGTLRSLDVVDGRGIALLVSSAVVAAFMDGYTFVMFALAAGAIGFGALVTSRSREKRRHLLLRVFPAHLAAFGVALVAYRAYVHGGDYGASPLEMFRAWGMDLTFAFIPTTGEFWLWDLLHATTPRTSRLFYGDASVWATTFAAPLLMVAAVAAWQIRRHVLTATLVVVALLAFYLALGPSLKVDSRKPSGSTDVFMPADAALAPTGSAYLSEHVPGFRLMRAAYRWAALGHFACWLLLVIAVGERRLGRPSVAYALVGLVLVMLLPHPLRNLRDGRIYRAMAASIDGQWVEPLRALRLGPIIAFAPHGNDFLAAYTAARLHVSTFNAGGDKNVEQASAGWPGDMARLGDPADPSAVGSIERFLLHGVGDQVVIPYVDLLGSAHFWPCVPRDPLDESSTHRAGPVSSACVNATRARYGATVGELARSPYIDVVQEDFFAVVSLKPAYAGESGRQQAQSELLSSVRYPIDVVGDAKAAELVLGDGWNAREPVNRWSQASAGLTLAVPPSCTGGGCRAVFHVVAFAASATRPVVASITATDHPEVSASVRFLDEGDHELVLEIPKGQSVLSLRLDVPAAMSPAALGMSADARVLGISLKRIDLQP